MLRKQLARRQSKQVSGPGSAAHSALPYRWSQDLELVSVSVPLPKGTRAKDLTVVMQRRKLKVSLLTTDLTKVQLKSSPEALIDGELFNDIAVDDSSWTIRELRLARS
jgi:hypothetical protein